MTRMENVNNTPAPEFKLALGENLEIWYTHIDNIYEQDRNAQVMPPEMLEALSKNIAKEKRLESLPFVVKRMKGENVVFELISGHHRVRASRMAGVNYIYVLADTRDLNRSKIVAKQIAHNSISGKSDEQILKEMFKEIDDVNDMFESYINPEDLKIYTPDVAPKSEQVSLEFDFKTVSFVFLESQFDKFEEVVDVLPPDESEIDLCPQSQYLKFKEVFEKTGKTCNIRSSGSIMAKIIDVMRRENGMEHDESSVSIVDLFGVQAIPVEMANKIKEKMKEKKIFVKEGDISAIERMFE